MLSVRGGPPFDYRDNVNITSDKKKTSPLQYIPPVPEKYHSQNLSLIDYFSFIVGLTCHLKMLKTMKKVLSEKLNLEVDQ